jgi:putative conjugative transposon mobilization protein
MRDSDKMIADLEAGGITSLDDLRGFFWNFKHPDDHTDELAELDKKIRGIDKLINMMKQHSQNYDIYKEYQERSAFTQKHFRKKNAAAIDAFEEADKYIAEHIKAYYIKGKPPKLCDLQAKSTKLKEKYNALVPEHCAFVTKRDTAHKYTRQVRNYLQNKEQQERNRQYQEKKRTQQRRKDTLE